MGKGSDKDWPAEDGHPSEDELLLYVDGELEAKEASYVRAHLEACWSCRVRTEKVQETISSFINYRNSVLKPLIEPPPHGWRGFDGKLGRLAAESGNRPPFSNLLGSLRKFFSVGRLFNMPRPMVRAAVGLIITVIVVALAVRFRQEPVVSAGELLKNATDAQATQIRATAQPVVYQKLRVRRKDQASSREEIVNLEIWNDTSNSRFRQSLADGGARQLIPSAADSSAVKTDQREGTSVPAVLTELEQVLRANHLDPRQPLSPASYQAWRNSLAQKNDEVTREQLPGGLEALTLRTVPAGQVGVGQIAEAVLVVRAKDWHPVEQRLRVRGEGGDRVYELSETSFEVVSLTALSPEIFAEPKQVASAPTPGAVPTATPTPLLAASLRPSPLMIAPPARPVATADLEVEVLRLLNQAGADLGEQVSAARTADGLLRVEGIVETDARKAEILRALEPVVNDPAVQIEIKTVAEAVAEQNQAKSKNKPNKNNSSDAPPVVQMEMREVEGNSYPAETEVRAYFAKQGAGDEAVRKYASGMVSRSNQAMRYAYALKRLRTQFTLAQLKELKPEARAKWLGLVKTYARSYQSEINALKRELQPLFGGAGDGSGGGSGIDGDAEILSAIDRMFAAGEASDRSVKAAFTTSDAKGSGNSIKSAQFWNNLANAETLAKNLQAAK